MWRAAAMTANAAARLAHVTASPTRALALALVRTASAAPGLRTLGTTTANAAPAADEQLLAMVLRSSKWTQAGPSAPLAKVYEFKDAKSRDTFLARARDLQLRSGIAFALTTQGDLAAVVQARAAAPGGGAVAQGPVSQDELELALAVDEVAAELQLGGRWN